MNVELRAGSEDRVLLVMPLFHIGAMFIGLGAHFRGGTSVLHRQFDPGAALGAAHTRQFADAVEVVRCRTLSSSGAERKPTF
jgi:acyl-CoA synthetase (AMP-forming)/AMP-acid ligase II